MGLIAAFVVRFAVAVVALLVAALVLDDFDISTLAFPLVALIYTVIAMIAQPGIEKLLEDRGWWASTAVGLLAAFVALLVTDLITDDLEISGIGTWIMATVIVWIAGVLANLLLGRWLYRRIAGDERR